MEKKFVIELASNGVLTFSDSPGTRLECLEGTVWITEDGSSDDVVLDPGRRHDVARKGVTVVQALSPARIAILETAPENGVRPHFWKIGTVPI